MKWKNLILSIAGSLLLIFFLANCGDAPKPPSSNARNSTIKLVLGQSQCTFPPYGGYTCEIEIVGINNDKNGTNIWKVYGKTEADFSGSPPSITVQVPSGGQFQINVRLQAKSCLPNCCAKCTVSNKGRPLYIGSTGMADYRGSYDIKIDQVACRCC